MHIRVQAVLMLCADWQVAKRCKCKLFANKRKLGIMSQLDLPGAVLSSNLSGSCDTCCHTCV